MAQNENPAQPVGAGFRPLRPVILGITGGVAAGKSTVAGLFRARGLAHVDADQVAREVTAEPEILARLAERFGSEVVTAAGLDRAAMARLVFAEPGRRAELESILHPPIRARILATLDEHRTAGRSVLLDAPLLHETGLVEFCDATVFVATRLATRQQRAAARGWDDGELERREAAQLPLDVKKQRACHTIPNDGDLTATAAAVDRVLAALAAKESR